MTTNDRTLRALNALDASDYHNAPEPFQFAWLAGWHDFPPFCETNIISDDHAEAYANGRHFRINSDAVLAFNEMQS